MKQPICILGVIDDRLYCKVNCFSDGYSKLYWYPEGKEEDTKYVSFRIPYITIKGLKDGYYHFYTRNSSTYGRSPELVIYFSTISPERIVSRLWEAAAVEENEYTETIKTDILNILEKYPLASVSKILHNLYLKHNTLEDFEEEIFYSLIKTEEILENLILGNLNRYGASFSKLITAPKPKISCPEETTAIKVYKFGDNGNQLYRTFWNPGSNITFELPLGYYEFQIFVDNNLVSILKHCRVSEGYLAKLWEHVEETVTDYEDTFANIILNDTTLTDSVLSNYKEELVYTPDTIVFPRIKVQESNINRAVNLFIEGVSYAMISNHTFYVSGKDIEFLSETVWNRFFILSGSLDEITVPFEPAMNMIDSEAFLYIVDENNTVVSRITRCIFDQDPDTSLKDYYEDIRRFEISQRMTRIQEQLTATYPGALTYIKELTDFCLDNEEVNIDNILQFVLSQRIPNDIDSDLFSFEILKDHFTNLNYNPSFFSKGGFSWRPYIHTITTEESSDGYVLCILAKYDDEESFHKHYVHSKTDQAIDLLLNKYGRFVVFAVSEKDYSYSGFLYLNTTTKYTNGYLLDWEVR